MDYYIAHFLSSIEVGDAGQCCPGYEYYSGQYDISVHRRFVYSMQVVMGVFKNALIFRKQK